MKALWHQTTALNPSFEALHRCLDEDWFLLEHELKRGLYIRANFDFEYDEYEIKTTTIEEMDAKMLDTRRAQVVDCGVRSSSVNGLDKIIGWTDEGYYIELLTGQEMVGHRSKVIIQDVRRSFAVGDVIVAGAVKTPKP